MSWGKVTLAWATLPASWRSPWPVGSPAAATKAEILADQAARDFLRACSAVRELKRGAPFSSIT